MAPIATLIAIACAGVIAGTVVGRRLLNQVPERRFRQVVGTTVLILGLATLLSSLGSWNVEPGRLLPDR
jgi:uncharacterized membrane protein YfcA